MIKKNSLGTWILSKNEMLGFYLKGGGLNVLIVIEN